MILFFFLKGWERWLYSLYISLKRQLFGFVLFNTSNMLSATHWIDVIAVVFILKPVWLYLFKTIQINFLWNFTRKENLKQRFPIRQTTFLSPRFEIKMTIFILIKPSLDVY